MSIENDKKNNITLFIWHRNYSASYISVKISDLKSWARNLAGHCHNKLRSEAQEHFLLWFVNDLMKEIHLYTPALHNKNLERSSITKYSSKRKYQNEIIIFRLLLMYPTNRPTHEMWNVILIMAITEAAWKVNIFIFIPWIITKYSDAIHSQNISHTNNTSFYFQEPMPVYYQLNVILIQDLTKWNCHHVCHWIVWSILNLLSR